MLGLENPLHLVFLLGVLLLVFGAKRLPEVGRSLGAGLRGFKESINDEGPAGELPSAAEITGQRAGEGLAEQPTIRPAA
jgi:sec-independent protein translocase protein TatA